MTHKRGPDVVGAFCAERRKALLTDLQRGGPILLLIAAGLALVVLVFASPHQVIGTTYGRAEGMHQVQSETGRGPVRIAVLLESGERVTMRLTSGELYREGARIEVRVERRAWFPTSKVHYFVGYADHEGNS